jgi:hypothetical protein
MTIAGSNRASVTKGCQHSPGSQGTKKNLSVYITHNKRANVGLLFFI